MTSEIKEEDFVSNIYNEFILDNYEKALTDVESLINKYKDSPLKNKYILYKIICNIKVGKYEDAFKDFDLLEKDENFVKTYKYYLAKGRCLFYLTKYEDSKKILEEGKALLKPEENNNQINLFDNLIKKIDKLTLK